MDREPDWLTVEDIVAFHEVLIATFGGSTGIRDAGLLESAIGRPRHVFAYESQDLFVLAGSYAHGLVKNHPFVDGNKRVAFVAARVFLGMNRLSFEPPEVEAVVMVEGLAGGQVRQEDFVSWLRTHSKVRRRRSRQ
jgi:death-on-curing protein